jgi:tRNA (guanine-N7-)-methyltransferase
MLRGIKSFVLRAGRISPRQQKGLNQCFPTYQLQLKDHPWDFASIFNRQADTIVEIGFGMGASLLEMAQSHLELNFIGIEVHRAGVGSLAAELQEKGITNVRLVMEDAVEVFKTGFSPSSLFGVQIFFPDPWHKKRHNKRRLIQPEFIKVILPSLQPNGFIHAATDWEDYAEHMLSVLSTQPLLSNSEPEGGYTPRPLTRPITKFEKRGQSLGHGVWDLVFKKRI